MCVNIRECSRAASCFSSAGEFSGSERRKDELMRRRPLLLDRSQLLRRAPLLLGVEQRRQLPVPVPLSGLSDLKGWDVSQQIKRSLIQEIPTSR